MKCSLNIILCDGDPEDPIAEFRAENASFCPQVGDKVTFDSGTADEADDIEGRVVSREFRFSILSSHIEVIAEPVQ